MPASLPLAPEEWALWDNWLRAQRLLCRELERALVRDVDISAAEFSLLATLQRAPGSRRRVGELAEALDWDKSRVAHQLTRLERRAFVTRVDGRPQGRRTGVTLTRTGRDAVEQAFRDHGANLRRLFLESLSAEQAHVIRQWSETVIDQVESIRDPGPDAM